VNRSFRSGFLSKEGELVGLPHSSFLGPAVDDDGMYYHRNDYSVGKKKSRRFPKKIGESSWDAGGFLLFIRVQGVFTK
jgi:hypothetical protein